MTIPKYEVKLLTSNEMELSLHLEYMQNEGWEIAGNVLLSNVGDCSGTIFFIPMKRIIPESNPKETHRCESCKFFKVSIMQDPCFSCNSESNLWEA